MELTEWYYAGATAYMYENYSKLFGSAKDALQ